MRLLRSRRASQPNTRTIIRYRSRTATDMIIPDVQGAPVPAGEPRSAAFWHGTRCPPRPMSTSPRTGVILRRRFTGSSRPGGAGAITVPKCSNCRYIADAMTNREDS